MSLIPTIYKSTDPGAPALTGQAGSLNNVLRACLVNGYGSGTDAKAAAGWTQPFVSGYIAVFRNNPVTGTGGYIRVDDRGTASGSNQKVALLRAYKTMTAVSTGAEPAPTVAQRSFGCPCIKSQTLDATPRAWVVFATERWFYLFVDTGNDTDAVDIATAPCFVGDPVSRRPADGFNFVIIPPSDSGPGDSYIYSATWAITNFRSYLGDKGYILRGNGLQVGAKGVCLTCCSTGGASYAIGDDGSMQIADPVSGGLVVGKVFVAESDGALRALMPNIYAPLHRAGFADLQQVPFVEGVSVPLLGKRISGRLPEGGGDAWGSAPGYRGGVVSLFDPVDLTRFDAYRGDGYFAGTVPPVGSTDPALDGRFRALNVPVIGRVTVHESGSMTTIVETRSADDGTYKVEYLDRGRKYVLIGWDDTGAQEAQIFTRQTPAPMT